MNLGSRRRGIDTPFGSVANERERAVYGIVATEITNSGFAKF